MASTLGDPAYPQLLEHHNKTLDGLDKSNNVDVIYLYFAKANIKVDQVILLNQLKKSELIVKTLCGYTIFYQTDNVLPSMEQHQMKLKLEVAYSKGQC